MRFYAQNQNYRSPKSQLQGFAAKIRKSHSARLWYSGRSGIYCKWLAFLPVRIRPFYRFRQLAEQRPDPAVASFGQRKHYFCLAAGILSGAKPLCSWQAVRPLQTFKSKDVVVKIVFNNNLLEVGNTGTSLKSSRHFASTGRSNSRSVVGLLN